MPVTTREDERRAYVCTHKECVPPQRVFLLPGDADGVPRCPSGHGKMQRQGNVPYSRPEPGVVGKPKVIRTPPQRPRASRNGSAPSTGLGRDA